MSITTMMMIIYLLFIIHSVCQFNGVNAFPSGAGHCQEGDLSGKNSIHGNGGGGPLSNGQISVTIGANSIKTWTPTKLEPNKKYRVTLSRSLFSFRGLLFRLSSVNGNNVFGTLTPSDDPNVRTLTSGCAFDVSAVTHTINLDKTSVYFDFEYTAGTADNLLLEVTVMISKSPGNWFYSRYELTMEAPGTPTPSGVPSGVPSIKPSPGSTPAPSSVPSTEPSPGLTPAPSGVPSTKPALGLTPAPSGVPSIMPSPGPAVCEDSTYKFKTRRPSDMKQIWGTCVWAAKKPSRRCAWKRVSSYCPLTCNSCDPCIDAIGKFKFQRNPTDTYKWLRNCRWTGLEPTERCAIVDMDRTCRVTCGNCPAR